MHYNDLLINVLIHRWFSQSTRVLLVVEQGLEKGKADDEGITPLMLSA